MATKIQIWVLCIVHIPNTVSIMKLQRYLLTGHIAQMVISNVVFNAVVWKHKTKRVQGKAKAKMEWQYQNKSDLTGV